MPDSPPLVWRLEGHKAGDNAQLRRLSAALETEYGWRSLGIDMRYRWFELMLHWRSRPTLAGLTRPARRRFAPPWPDVVLSAGRRNELPARWLGARHGSRTVHVGRPWSDPETFDLVITSPQYHLAGGANVVELPFPLVTPAAGGPTDTAPDVEIGNLPKPHTVVLIGGDSGPYVYHAQRARALARSLHAFGEKRQGTLLIVTSRRTPGRFVDRLAGSLETRHRVFEWQPNAKGNIYRELLELADDFIVTSDSASMVTDALATGKPTRIYDLDGEPDRGWYRLAAFRWKPLTHHLAQRYASARMQRSVRAMLQGWVEAGYAAWLDEDVPEFQPRPLDLEPLVSRAAEQVRNIL